MVPFATSFVKRWAASAALLLMFSASGHATLIDFEDVGSARNVSPSTPYSAFGFTFTPTNDGSGIFQNVMPGDATFTFDFQGADGVPNGPFLNPITLTGPGNFDLTTFIAGRTTFAPSAFPTVDLTVTGYFSNGTTQAQTFAGLTTAALETVDWTHLTSVVFTSSADAGIDNLAVAVDAVSGVPEPGTLALLMVAGAALISIRRLSTPHKPVGPHCRLR